MSSLIKPHIAPYFALLLIAICANTISTLSAAESAPEPDAAQAAKDASTVEALMRLPNFDLSTSPPVKASVVRYLQANRGTERYFQLIAQFTLREFSPDLVRLVIEQPGSTAGVTATRTLVKLGDRKLLESSVADADAQTAASAATALGYVGDPAAIEFLAQAIGNENLPVAVRSAAAKSMARNRSGETLLLQRVIDKSLPSDLKFSVANLLHASRDAAVRKAATEHLPLPAASAGTPLPPVAQLVTRSGEGQNGMSVFTTKGTCANCHKVAGQGKEVGPDLSEIGSKLSKEAIYVSILDPNAGISHNYENYEVITVNGQVATGLLVSRTDDEVRLRNAEAVELSFAMDDVDEITKLELSLMPAGLQQNMTVEELVDLVEYLTTLKKSEN